MTKHHTRRWFQLSLKSLFLLVLLVATFFAGYTLATKQAEAERRRAEEEAQRAIEEARGQAEAQAALLQAQNQPWRDWSSSGTVAWPQSNH
jgi:predicted negative regulator of RcsB-dependent stress response